MYDSSIFRFPPLGLGYIASSLRKHGIHVELIDCTFLSPEEALLRIKRSKPQIVGFYSMFSMKKTSMDMASKLRNDCNLLVAGGPLPTLDPVSYLDVFDLVVVGEGEQSMVELAECCEKGADFSNIQGIVYLSNR
jgi:anaerobic magnesium-protoporphyrin IX monomethyl ester cyclase